MDENVVPPRACRAGADTYEQSAQSTSVLYSNSMTATLYLTARARAATCGVEQ